LDSTPTPASTSSSTSTSASRWFQFKSWFSKCCRSCFCCCHRRQPRHANE
jgi:hypothetical protein